MAEKHLTIKELAERLRVEVNTIYGWNRRGEGPPYMRIGRACIWRLADVVAWEESRLVDQTRDEAA